MHFDDRLATVLHHRAAGARAARVQFRQLLDLLGEPHGAIEPGLARAAYRRLDALAAMIPAAQRERIAAECSQRIREPRLLAWLAAAEPKVALAGLSRATLDDAQWQALIPALPIGARGLLRHRRNLPRSAQQLLDRLGVRDRILPEPRAAETIEAATDPAAHADLPVLELGAATEGDYVLEPAATAERPGSAGVRARSGADTSELGELVQRIEAFQRARANRVAAPTADHPRLPLGGEAGEERAPKLLAAFLFTTDEAGRIDWAEAPAGPLVTGTLLARGGPSEPGTFARALAFRRPVAAAAIDLAGAEAIAGGWTVDAAPRFASQGGRFLGYVGRFRRPAVVNADTAAQRAADRLRQLLHELRTPVTAIQGFAEVIQQQTVGPVPHEYRALAAGIAGDAARMLAGFAELERLARLEAGTQDLAEGTCDFIVIAKRQVAQLQTVLSPRVSRIDGSWQIGEAKIAMAPEDAETLAWRFLGTLASAMAAGERIALDAATDGGWLRLAARLPAALAQSEDIFAGDVRPGGGPLATGLFGVGFALRLARAEARGAGGDITVDEQRLAVLTLPLADGITTGRDMPHRASERIA